MSETETEEGGTVTEATISGHGVKLLREAIWQSTFATIYAMQLALHQGDGERARRATEAAIREGKRARKL